MANSALRLRAVLDFEDESGEKRVAGDEWLFEGPGIFLHNAFILIETKILDYNLDLAKQRQRRKVSYCNQQLCLCPLFL